MIFTPRLFQVFCQCVTILLLDVIYNDGLVVTTICHRVVRFEMNLLTWEFGIFDRWLYAVLVLPVMRCNALMFDI